MLSVVPDASDLTHSLRQQAHVQLTPEAATWCHRRLQAAFEMHGRLADTVVEDLRAADPLDV
jgi:hypothetical protein